MSNKVELTDELKESLRNQVEEGTEYSLLDLFLQYDGQRFITAQLGGKQFLVLTERGQAVSRPKSEKILEVMLKYYSFYQHAMEQTQLYARRNIRHFVDLKVLLERMEEQLGDRLDEVRAAMQNMQNMCEQVVDGQQNMIELKEQVVQYKDETLDDKGYLTAEDAQWMMNKQTEIDWILYEQGRQIYNREDDIRQLSEHFSRELSWTEKIRPTYLGLRGILRSFLTDEVLRKNKESLHSFETDEHGRAIVSETGTMQREQLLSLKESLFAQHFQEELLPLLANE